MCGLSMRNVQTLSAWCMVLHTDSAYLWVLVYSSHLNSNRAMLAYVASGPSGSHSTLVCGTVAPGDQRSGVWHAVAHGCFPVQRQSGISSCVKQAHATLNFNADTKTTEIWFTPHPDVLWDHLISGSNQNGRHACWWCVGRSRLYQRDTAVSTGDSLSNVATSRLQNKRAAVWKHTATAPCFYLLPDFLRHTAGTLRAARS